MPGATAPAGFFGLNYYFKDITSGDVLYLKKSGAKTVRWRMNWSNIEPSSGHFDWSAADAVVGDLAAQGIRVLPVMWGSPGWVASSAITPPISTQKQRDAWSGVPAARRSSDTARGGELLDRCLPDTASRQDTAADRHLADLERSQSEVMR